MNAINTLVKSRSSSSIHGAVTGIVTNNQDPDKMGRIKVKFPWLSEDEESAWARVASVSAGKEKGFVFLPEVDDEVLVVFQNGNMNMPYIIGSLWNGKDVPPETNADGDNNTKMIKTRSGHTIKFSDKDGEEKIEIIDGKEENTIVIDTKESKITITSKKDIEINAPDGKVSIKAKEIEMKTDSKFLIDAGADADIKSGANVNVKGSTINLN